MKPDGKSKSDLSTRTRIFMSAFYSYIIHFKCTLYMYYLFSIIRCPIELSKDMNVFLS